MSAFYWEQLKFLEFFLCGWHCSRCHKKVEEKSYGGWRSSCSKKPKKLRSVWHLSWQVRGEAESRGSGIAIKCAPAPFPLPSFPSALTLRALCPPSPPRHPGPPDTKMSCRVLPAPHRGSLPRPVPCFGIPTTDDCRSRLGQPGESRG